MIERIVIKEEITVDEQTFLCIAIADVEYSIEDETYSDHYGRVRSTPRVLIEDVVFDEVQIEETESECRPQGNDLAKVLSAFQARVLAMKNTYEIDIQELMESYHEDYLI